VHSAQGAARKGLATGLYEWRTPWRSVRRRAAGVRAMAAARARDLYLFVGERAAQQLLFRSTAAGDLTADISTFYDTAIGLKTESASYRRIVESHRRAANEVLFISDR